MASKTSNAPFYRRVLLLASGTASGQLVALATLPYISRLYGPAEFGILAVFASMVAVLSVFGNLRYDLAITIPEENLDALSLLWLCRAISIACAVLVGVVISLVGDEIAQIFNISEESNYLFFVPVWLLLASMLQCQTSWVLRQQNFKTLGVSKFAQSVAIAVVQVVASPLGALGLLLGRIAGHAACFIVLFSGENAYSNPAAVNARNVRSIKSIASRYRNFPIVSTWAGLAGAVASNCTPLLIIGLFGAGPAGWVSLAHRVMSQPMMLIGKAVGDVFYRDAPEAFRRGQLGKTVESLSENLTFCAVPIAWLLMFVLPALFPFVFGHSWTTAGYIASLMVPWLLMQFVVTPVTRIFPVMDKHVIALRFQLSLFFSSTLAILFGAFVLEDLVQSIALLSSLNALIYLLRLIITFQLVGLDWWRPLTVLAKAFCIAVTLNLPVSVCTVVSKTSSRLDIGLAVPALISLGLVAAYSLYRVRKVSSFATS